MVNAKRKAKMLHLLVLQRAPLKGDFLEYDEFFGVVGAENDDSESSESNESGDSDEEEILNYIGTLELDTLMWPTISGKLDLEEINDNYYAHGTLVTAHGGFVIKNHLNYPVGCFFYKSI